MKDCHWYISMDFLHDGWCFALSSASPWYYVIAWFFCSLLKIKKHYWGNVKNSFAIFYNHPFEGGIFVLYYCFPLKGLIPFLVWWQSMLFIDRQCHSEQRLILQFQAHLIYTLVQSLLGNEKQWKSWLPFPSFLTFTVHFNLSLLPYWPSVPANCKNEDRTPDPIQALWW